MAQWDSQATPFWLVHIPWCSVLPGLIRENVSIYLYKSQAQSEAEPDAICHVPGDRGLRRVGQPPYAWLFPSPLPPRSQKNLLNLGARGVTRHRQLGWPSPPRQPSVPARPQGGRTRGL